MGNDAAQAAFLAELLRVGRKLFLTTPTRWYPVELHTVLPFAHWLPQRAHQRILRMLGMHFYAETENLNLLTKKKLLGMLPPPYKGRVRIHFNRLFGWSSNIVLYVE
jgi:hypothetical protein